MTATPRRSRLVHAAAQDSSSSGASIAAPPTVCSDVHAPSKPSSSARTR